MPSRICASCLKFDINKIVKSQSQLKPSWLLKKDYVLEFVSKININTKRRKPENSDVRMRLNLGSNMKNRKVLYWAAKPNNSNSVLIKDAKSAYSNFANHGISYSNKDGETILTFECPQNYYTIQKGNKKPLTYFRHVHFVVSNSTKTAWEPQIYTKIVVCQFNYSKIKKMLSEKKHVFINALPSQYYGMDHIPNSFNLHYKDVKKMTVSNLEQWFKFLISIHYPKLHNLVKQNKLKIYELPIIVYCAHGECNASDLAIEELMKKGFVNINEYHGGIREYRKYNKNDN